MSGDTRDALAAHLATGATTVCRCWQVRRVDGTAYGFTDHDRDLVFEGQLFRAQTGMSAGMVESSTGLSVDNTEAVGALSDTALTEADIEAGRFDRAEVTAWLVNWADVNDRAVQFKGSLGEIRRVGGRFHAELRGLTEALNRAQGMIYHGHCSAVLGDARCRVDMDDPWHSVEVEVVEARDRKWFRLYGTGGFGPGWFERGRLRMLSGDAAGLAGVLRTDVSTDDGREITLWQPLGAAVSAGDVARLEAGCDKRAETCRAKFGNFLNFRGFPHIPGEDWLMRYPVSRNDNDGGALV